MSDGPRVVFLAWNTATASGLVCFRFMNCSAAVSNDSRAAIMWFVPTLLGFMCSCCRFTGVFVVWIKNPKPSGFAFAAPFNSSRFMVVSGWYIAIIHMFFYCGRKCLVLNSSIRFLF